MKPGLAKLVPILLLGLLSLPLGSGCHRNVEDFDPDEKVAQPDLSKIFPAGAERAALAERPAQPAAGAGPGAGAAPPGSRGATASPIPGTRGTTAPPAPGGDAAPLTGTLTLGAGLVPPQGAILFLSARTREGMPPTAAKRITGASFPLRFSLGPEDRMIESFPFEGPFEITARLDTDGNAMTRSPGDIQGRSSGHMPGEGGIAIVLDEVL